MRNDTYEVISKITVLIAIVKSESIEGAYYKVTFTNEEDWKCTCPDHVNRQHRCKHIEQVRDNESL